MAQKIFLDTRAALLNAAGPVFADKGLEGATVKDIATAAGVNSALVSYHFGGKEALYRAVLESMGRERLEAAERMLKPALNREEFVLRLKLFFEEFLQFHLNSPHVLKIFQRDFDGRQPIAFEVFRSVFFALFLKAKNYLDAAKKRGLLRKDLDSDSCTTLMFGGIFHAVRMDLLRRDEVSERLNNPEFATRFVDQFVKNICEGVFSRGGH